MYSFLYYYLYLLGTKRKNSIAEFNAASFVFLAQLGHFLLVTEIITIITGIKIPVYSNDYTINRLSYYPFLIIWLYLVNKYFKKQSRSIYLKYQNKEILTIKNGLMSFLLIVAPYAILIFYAINKKQITSIFFTP